MLRTTESETEILLGNKQLLGIFFVVAILLGIAFYGGYMVGRAAPAKTAAAPVANSNEPAAAPAASPSGTGGETHSFPADSTGTADQNAVAPSSEKAQNRSTEPGTEERPLGAPKPAVSEKSASSLENFTPQPGQQFLQVAAVGRDEAEAIADVLHKKGFRAHAIPKPGSVKLYRVLIGPMRDAGDLSATRDALRRTGFREVIVQRY